MPLRQSERPAQRPVVGHFVPTAEKLDAIVLQHGGRVYLAKDASLSSESFRGMYPDADRFREIQNRVDPGRRFSSALARRVGLVESA